MEQKLTQGLTFDDVLLTPAYSQVLPKDVDISTKLTRHITLNIPLLSAAMDTVTEAQLAIALAREGGLGILHKNMTIEGQASQVKKVKRSENGLILDPITLTADATIGEALKLMRDNKIGGIPIIDKAHKLIGILTNRDLRFETNLKEKVKRRNDQRKFNNSARRNRFKKSTTIIQKKQGRKTSGGR
ncbi:MAG: IMP dehydrogenase [Chitinophagaceae bacterium]|nr:IMP dehydrogenase [Chitinophagaceae bacterium]